jgi:hypothetical protein
MFCESEANDAAHRIAEEMRTSKILGIQHCNDVAGHNSPSVCVGIVRFVALTVPACMKQDESIILLQR